MKDLLQSISIKIESGSFITKGQIRLISSFLVGQGVVQFVQLLTGFLLIRWLTVEQYAQYSVAFAFQSTAQILVELGFSGSVIALVGSRVYNKEVLGGYIKAGKFFRNRLFAVVGVICLVGFPIITSHHQWPYYITILLLVAILSNLYLSGNSAFYASPLIIHARLKDFYRIQLKSGLFRLSFLGILSIFSIINAWLAALATSFLIWYNGKHYKDRSQEYIIEPASSSSETKKEMLQYVKPVMPGIIYSAFSAQIALFLISIFGNTQNIAEVGALGRVGQIFFILNAASSTLIVPFLARQPGEGLSKKYFSIISGALAIAALLSIIAFLFPQPFLWIMGSKYDHLDREVGLLVLNSAIIFLNVVMWDMNCSRKWLWYWIPIVSISSNILLQIFLIFKMDLNTTYNVLIYAIILSVFNLSNKVLVAFIGLKKTKDEVNLLSEGS